MGLVLKNLLSGPHSQALRSLESLSFRLKCWGDHYLGFLKLLDIRVTAGRKARPKAPEEV